MSRRAAVLPIICLAAAVTAVAPVPAGAALSLGRCPRIPGYVCGSLRVPLDRTGATPGSLRLRVAAQRRRKRHAGVLLALSGGPGQQSVAYATSFAETLRPALARRRLVVFDQRGTGASGALSCPALQRTRALDPIDPRSVAACAQRIGPSARNYATTDTVADIEALRQALGVERIGLMGISYGTYVALQYARTYPEHVERLILDSVVGPDGIEPFLLDSFSRARRLLTEQCAARRCRYATADPVGDVAAVVERLAAGPLRGLLFNARGHARPAALRDSSQLFLMLLAADLNPYVQAGLPGAIAAARRGDPATLLRLQRLADGTPSRVRDLSAGLNAVTVCADTALPYALTTPVAERPGLIAGALDAIAPELFAPFDRQALLAPSIADDCSLYPEGEAAPASSEAPLPDVPALLLNGRLDWRTPLENADAVAALLPRARRVYVPGTGHDVLDSDYTGCAERALSRFIGGRRMGRPCRGKTNAQLPYPIPAPSLAAVAPAPGIPGRRGRVVAAALDTVRDARIAATQALWAGFRRLRGGGLRGGSFSGTLDAERLRLGGYKYVDEVRVSGSLRAAGNGYRGRLRIEGPGNLDGFLQIDQHNRATGRIGGRGVAYRGARAAASAAATPGSWSPAGGLPLIPSHGARKPRPSR